MSNSSSFKYFTIRYYQIIPPMVLIIGCIGNVLNLVLFTRRTLRSNPCAIYFFLLSITKYLINLYVAERAQRADHVNCMQLFLTGMLIEII